MGDDESGGGVLSQGQTLPRGVGRDNLVAGPETSNQRTRHTGNSAMLTFGGTSRRYCDGVRRRDVLVAGALGLGGFTLAQLLRAEAAAAPASRRPKSVIYVVLGGGPSHIDMWDLKPD